ncbi:hypothetical protein CF70_016865 [Cupriavidus sp. SK-3]|nr:hypothetical protein CF70_016865 [Cupriavidus sp. SK-3]
MTFKLQGGRGGIRAAVRRSRLIESSMCHTRMRSKLIMLSGTHMGSGVLPDQKAVISDPLNSVSINLRTSSDW